MARGFRLDTLYYDVEARVDKLGPGLAAAERRLQRFAGVIKAHPVAALGALASTVVLVGIQAAKMAAQFDAAMRRVTASLPGATQQLARLRKAVIELSTQGTHSAEQLAAGLRAVVEVGGREMRDPIEAIARLRQAMTGAQATGEELSTVVRTLDDVMDAFSLSGNAAAKQVLDLLVQGGRAGVPFAQLANTVADVAPAAAAAGVPLDRLVAMIVALNDGLVPAGQQARVLRQAFSGLREEGEESLNLFRSYGVTIEQLGGQYVLGARGAEAFARANQEIANSVDAAARAAQHVTEGPGARFQAWLSGFNARLLEFGDHLTSIFSPEMDRRLRNFLSAPSGPGVFGGFGIGPQPPPSGRVPLTGADRASRLGISVTAAPPTAPDPDAVRRQAEAQQRAMEELQDQLNQITSATFDDVRTRIDRLAAKFEEAFRGRIPEAARIGLQELRDQLEQQERRAAETDLSREAEGVLGGELARLRRLAAEEGTNLDELRGRAGQLGDQIRAALTVHPDDQALRDLLEEIAEFERQITQQEKAQADASAAKRDAIGDQAKLDRERVEHLQQQARNIEASARGALQLAEAFGVLDDETAAALQNIAQIAANLPGAASGDIGSIVSVLGGIAGLLGGGGESPEERARKEALRKNTEAIEVLARQLGEFGLNITGSQFFGVRRAVRSGIQVGEQLLGAAAQQGAIDRVLNQALQGLGLSMRDLRQVAQELDITIAGATPTFDELRSLLQAIQETELTRFAETFTGQMEALRAEFELFDIDDPIRQLERLRDVMSDPKFGAPALRDALAGLDLSSAEGRAEAERRIQALFNMMRTGALTTQQIGGLSPEQFLQALLQLEATIDQANQTAGGTTETFGINRSISEVTGSRIAAYLSTIAYQSGRAADLLAQLLESVSRRYSVLPPTVAEVDRFAGAVGGMTINVTVNVSGPMSAGDARRTGAEVGLAAAEEINRQLGALARQRARALGRVTLSTN